MQIKNLKINGFGKIKNKEISFNDGINIIYGKNEAGKSTILKYIISMFYGLSKNKNGGTIPEVEKYEPWNNEEFSGKISYELDNKETYEVYRDFKKKNPKIFNQNLEDISKNFNIDKTRGNQFFYDQLGIEEEIFTSSIITKQAEVKLDDKAQNTLIQKISNILGTGEDTTSYTTILNKLKKKLNDEIGTSNTKERPINILENRISELEKEKNELENYKNSKLDIDERINEIAELIEKENKQLEKLKVANLQKEKLKEEENIIKINKDMINNIQADIDNLNKEKKTYKIDKSKEISKISIVVAFILFVLTIVSLIITKNIYLKIIMPLVFIVYIICIIVKLKIKQNNNKEIKLKQNQIEEKIKILEQNKKRQLEELEKIEKKYAEDLSKIKKESDINDLGNILELIENKQRKINEKMLNLHTLKMDNENITSKLENLVNVEEELEELKEEKRDLEEKRDNIKRAIQYLEIAYNKMKEQITPKFTKELSTAMEKISNGKYKNVRINTNGEIIVEANTGEYINVENLSIGTIDQLYLSLRLATIKEITKENMPIILDEAFAYYDDERLENILTYLENEYKEKQILIFTCTNREKETLEKNNFRFNLIEL